MQSPFDSPPQSFGHVIEEQSRPAKLASQVHVPLKHTPCEEQPLGQEDWPTAAPRRARAESLQPERAGLPWRESGVFRQGAIFSFRFGEGVYQRIPPEINLST